MSQSLLSLIWGIIFSFLHITMVMIALKILKKTAPVLLHAASALLSLIFLCLTNTTLQLDLWIAFSVLALGSSSYLFVFGAIYKSLTLRMLCSAQSQKEPISLEQLEILITLPTFLARMLLLSEMGHVTIEKDRYFLTKKGKKTANFFNVIRKIFHVETKAVYQPVLDQHGNLE